ncbi:hypothetical protein C0J29_32090 (plasmid) [Mycobacterium paragordonae]|uniref:Uncharacterized protein n=1 Tax=Mycobacterium paragordonae TaxID=1389713 RepID=A0ABQ1CG29_9MYCO|nr:MULTISPECIES: hypothetical protein [Mycobacterium]AYE99599.1 hypothetical protein C0J29_32090 [Mycobacterium paragordonae]QNI09739.1 hypothetical protein GAN17_25405 [Mycobacterium kubicae]QNI15250.1 hypothetical protein GAN18_29155 [Mycobacterium kubicae]GFG83172.1 hypothetical protein MPRG_64480 [Mycobacterium paragordonae]
MTATILGCLAAVIVVKLLFAWISRPKSTVHVHLPPPPAGAPSHVPAPVTVVMPVVIAPGTAVPEADAELHELIDDYYRDHGHLS